MAIDKYRDQRIRENRRIVNDTNRCYSIGRAKKPYTCLQIRGKTFILTELENLKTAGLNGLERKKTGKKNNHNNFMCDSVVKL